MPNPSIGHNRGPGFGWRRYAWKTARADLKPARVPLEIVRIRVRRAQRLGLSYPDYARILLGSGRDIVGFMFTVNGLQAQLLRNIRVPDHVSAKLGLLKQGERLALAPADEAADAFREELEAETGCVFASVAAAPAPRASWSEQRRAVRASFAGLKLPADAIVMIGDEREDPAWAAAAELAGHVPTTSYFGERP